MSIDVIIQRGYLQPLDILDKYKLRWNILFPFRSFSREILANSGFSSVEQLTHHIMGRRHRESLGDNCMYISIGTATAFVKVLKNILSYSDKFITEEVLEHYGTREQLEVMWDLYHAHDFFKKYLDLQATGEEIVFRSWW
jgi:hypothetical protein